MLVVIETDAYYREAGPAYVEVCPSCGRDRSAEDRCACGHRFERLTGPTARWGAAPITVRFPDRCPHCLERATREQSFFTRREVEVEAPRPESLPAFKVPVCNKVSSSRRYLYLALVALVAMIGALVWLGLTLAIGHAWIAPALASAVLAGLALWLYRKHSCFRLERYDHRSVTFRVRRERYARELARLNRGFCR